MDLKELSAVMQEHGASLVPSQEEALRYAGVDYLWYGYPDLRSPTPRTDVHLTTEPMAGELLLTGKWKETWNVFEVYKLSNGETVFICSRMLNVLFGSRKPEFLYLTKGETK